MATRRTSTTAKGSRDLSAPDSNVHVALLRGINVGGHKKVPMAELRALAAKLGWLDVRTHVQSGNVVFRAPDRKVDLAAVLEQAIERQFGFPVPVIVRTGTAWLAYAKGSGFPDAEADRPNLLHLCLGRGASAPRGTLQALEKYCTAGERIAIRGDAIWIDYQGGVARSKVTPAVLDRLVGSPVTARNWKSVQAIAALARDAR